MQCRETNSIAVDMEVSGIVRTGRSEATTGSSVFVVNIAAEWWGDIDHKVCQGRRSQDEAKKSNALGGRHRG